MDEIKDENISRVIRVIRSSRRTLSLEVTRDGIVVVRAPSFLSTVKIQNFVAEKKSWIEKKRSLVKNHLASKKIFRYVPGEEYSFLGVNYPLIFVDKKKPNLVLTDRFEMAASKRKHAPQIFLRWYKERALLVISDLVKQYATRNQLVYRKIGISSARTRWGSCNSRGHLSFSWRLIMAPEKVVTYVVVHELAHLMHHNHSKRFWRFVEKMMPGYKTQRRWLKEHGHTLVLD